MLESSFVFLYLLISLDRYNMDLYDNAVVLLINILFFFLGTSSNLWKLLLTIGSMDYICTSFFTLIHCGSNC
jgi:hypothetical protein